MIAALYLLLRRLRCHSKKDTKKATMMTVTPTAPLLAPELADTPSPSELKGSSPRSLYG